jgi:hypothetical protein
MAIADTARVLVDLTAPDGAMRDMRTDLALRRLPAAHLLAEE